jgi:hypothetical protein
LEKIPKEQTVKKVFNNISEGKRSVGKPRKRCLYDAENNLKKIVIGGWRRLTRNKDAWKLILKEVRPVHTVHPLGGVK